MVGLSEINNFRDALGIQNDVIDRQIEMGNVVGLQESDGVCNMH